MCQGLGQKKHNDISEIDRTLKLKAGAVFDQAVVGVPS